MATNATQITFTKVSDRYIATPQNDGSTLMIAVEFDSANDSSVRPLLQVQMRIDNSLAWSTEGEIRPERGGNTINFSVKYPEGADIRLVTRNKVQKAYYIKA